MNDKDYISYEEQLNDERWFAKRNKILRRDHFKCQICGEYSSENNPLNIHHRYYKHKALAWGYNDNALVTLCQNCHLLVHETISPVMYLEKGTCLIPLNLTPCKRCNGSGFFHEYRHIHSGMCFRCKGKRYEELINMDETPIVLSNYVLENDSLFDIVEPLRNTDENEALHQKGRNYHLGINGYAKDAEKAFEYYQMAALDGYGKAQNNLGVMYKMGMDGFDKDYTKARRWFTYASMQGISQAQSNLVEIFRDGLGVEVDETIANEWDKIACANNDDINSNHAMLDLLQSILLKSENEELQADRVQRIIEMAMEGNKYALEYLQSLLEMAGERIDE